MTMTRHTEEERELQRLYAALARVELSDVDRALLHLIAGWGPEIAEGVVSLLERQALAQEPRLPAQRGEAPGVREAYDMTVLPPGADPVLAEGLPTYMVLGVDPGPPRTPWWRCTRCRETTSGQPSRDAARAEADEHVARHHGGGR